MGVLSVVFPVVGGGFAASPSNAAQKHTLDCAFTDFQCVFICLFIYFGVKLSAWEFFSGDFLFTVDFLKLNGFILYSRQDMTFHRCSHVGVGVMYLRYLCELKVWD